MLLNYEKSIISSKIHIAGEGKRYILGINYKCILCTRLLSVRMKKTTNVPRKIFYIKFLLDCERSDECNIYFIIMTCFCVYE